MRGGKGGAGVSASPGGAVNYWLWGREYSGFPG